MKAMRFPDDVKVEKVVEENYSERRPDRVSALINLHNHVRLLSPSASGHSRVSDNGVYIHQGKNGRSSRNNKNNTKSEDLRDIGIA